ncbi:LLM class flavin-dependent oxidoreductase [Paraburkholderia unamae]|uniref:Luciferase-like monooxygenase n=1 Tax=Paraburkholderia unamae TaxID=219649 RepID=A0ABX5KXM1_9BURK|nr:LLM class flavin-dependent oxidoreductase [Paraburkholderia unamae]PVX85547.1 luciferase-like monooxygenase [Paraburkholderia unamae]RAR55244.1 luciferase-like monooxygenase [Paraburkholderia unamae]CAG9268076.1 putative Pristinamycin IIA synthase subunit B [Paraburkholderia unamae]
MPTDLVGAASLGDWHLYARNACGTRFGALRDLVLAAETAGATAFVVGTEEGGFEPLTLLCALAGITSRIGLVAGIDPRVVPPYTAARRLAALDHASNGRAGWHLARTVDEAQRREYLQVVHALWDSWAPDVHHCDKDSGVYVDASRVQAVQHEGAHYQVAGPLDIPRPQQGHLPLYAMDEVAGDEPHADVQPLASERVTFGPFTVAVTPLSYRHAVPDDASTPGRDALVHLPADAAMWPDFVAALARHARGISPERMTLRARLQLDSPGLARTKEAL